MHSSQAQAPVEDGTTLAQRAQGALDTTVKAAGIASSVVDAGLGAKSSLVAAATRGLLGLASRVPLVGQIAGVLQDVFAVYEVCIHVTVVAGPTDAWCRL
jgi:hypothetical protein